MTRLPDNAEVPETPSRISWRFAQDGRAVACTLVPPGSRPLLEISRLSAAGAVSRTALAVPSLGIHSQLVPISPGRALVCHHQNGGQQIELVAVRRGQPSVRRLVTAQLAGLRLIPLPGRSRATRAEEAGATHGGGPTTPGPGTVLAVAVSHSEDGRSTIWQLLAESALRPAAITPGIFTGGTWLDGQGRRLGGELSVDGRPGKGVAVDLATGSTETVLSLSETSNDRLVAFNARTGVLVVSTDLTGEVRLGVGRPEDGPVGFPAALHRSGHEVRLIALDQQGRSLLLAHEVGASSLLSVYDWETGKNIVVQAPPGVVVGGGVLERSVAHLVYSTPSQPASIITLRRDTSGWSAVDDAANSSNEHGQISARPVVFPGAAGPIETVTYGQPYHADQVVIALHGGPLSAWRLGYNPLLHALVAHGIAVVAPNQRGSTHYGVAHTMAIRQRWGGPDLDDVLAIARALSSDRAASAARPIVLGTSYGAFLALLAAAVDPALFTGCIAMAPFLSGPRLYPEAGEATRRIIERLGGMTVPVVDGKPRDVFDRCGEITAPVLIVHGIEDDVVPVGQSRLLHRRLMAAGHRDCELLEIPEGHDPAAGRRRRLVIDHVLRFCRRASADTFPGPNPPYELLERR